MTVSASPTDPAIPDRHLSRLSILLLSYVVCLCALATLAPFRFRAPSRFELNWWIGLHDVVLNLLLMFPAGFLYALGRTQGQSPGDSRAGVRTVLLSATMFGLLSATVEAAQMYLPNRATSPIDLICNTTGAALGAALLVWVRPWLQARVYNELTLRLPLSHLFYLLTLLVVIDGLMARTGGVRLWLSVPLGTCGALILVAVATHRFAPGGRTTWLTAMGAGLWFAVASATAWLRDPVVGVFGTAWVVLTAAVLHALGWPRTRQKRFESPTLRGTALPFAVYLGMLWHGYAPHIAPQKPSAAALQWMFDAIELLAAMTVLGYGIAEALGRRAWPGYTASFLGAVVSAGLLLIVDAVWPHPLHAEAGTAPAWPLLAGTTFAGWGALVYRAELRVVQALSRHARLQEAAAAPIVLRPAPRSEPPGPMLHGTGVKARRG